MNCQLPDVVALVGRFVSRTRGVAAEGVHAGTGLFKEGLLDSFSLVELTIELESALGATISEGMLLPEDFETPLTLFDRLRQL